MSLLCIPVTFPAPHQLVLLEQLDVKRPRSNPFTLPCSLFLNEGSNGETSLWVEVVPSKKAGALGSVSAAVSVEDPSSLDDLRGHQNLMGSLSLVGDFISLAVRRSSRSATRATSPPPIPVPTKPKRRSAAKTLKAAPTPAPIPAPAQVNTKTATKAKTPTPSASLSPTPAQTQPSASTSSSKVASSSAPSASAHWTALLPNLSTATAPANLAPRPLVRQAPAPLALPPPGTLWFSRWPSTHPKHTRPEDWIPQDDDDARLNTRLDDARRNHSGNVANISHRPTDQTPLPSRRRGARVARFAANPLTSALVFSVKDEPSAVRAYIPPSPSPLHPPQPDSARDNFTPLAAAQLSDPGLEVKVKIKDDRDVDAETAEQEDDVWFDAEDKPNDGEQGNPHPSTGYQPAPEVEGFWRRMLRWIGFRT